MADFLTFSQVLFLLKPPSLPPLFQIHIAISLFSSVSVSVFSFFNRALSLFLLKSIEVSRYERDSTKWVLLVMLYKEVRV